MVEEEEDLEGEEKADEAAEKEVAPPPGIPPEFDLQDMPLEAGERVLFMNATVTRKHTEKKGTFMKVHIPRVFAREGRECDVELKFGSNHSDQVAFALVKKYIWRRVKHS